jgi:hypothetical protein
MGDITTLQVQQFASRWDMLVQQTQSRFMPCITVGTGHYGKQASPVEQWGKVEVQEKTTRLQPVTFSDVPFERRWIFPSTFDAYVPLDKNDLQRLLMDPKAQQMQSLVSGLNRQRDRSIIAGILDANFTGEAGTTSTAFGTGQTISVNTGGAASTLNVAKVRAAFERMLINEVDVDGEEFYMAIDGRNHAALLAEVQVISKDFNSFDGNPVIQDGRLTKLFGFTFIHSERLTEFNGTDDGSGTSTPLPFWAKSGVYYGSWSETIARVVERNDLRGYPWQSSVEATFGASRLQEAKVGKIWARVA